MSTSTFKNLAHFCLVGLCLALPSQTESADLVLKQWWETALVYQIWPRGFQDSDGDGEGDLKGIISRLDYIQGLGVDAIHLNPIYPSPLVDSGYDVSNYTDINPLFGDLDQFNELLQEAHQRDLKVILDVDPNHSSDQHEWFQYSVDNVEPYKDYYVWADGYQNENGTKVPPNNWVSTFSNENASAWTWNEKRQQWYYHKFHESQPDLNLRSENVVQEFLNVFAFWLEKGVDGFRLNAVPYFFEDVDLQDEEIPGNGNYTFGLPECTNLLYSFRSYINDWVITNNETSKLLVAESYDTDENLIAYYGNETHAGFLPHNFRFITKIDKDSMAEEIKSIVEQWLDILPNNTSTNWVLSNQDNSRAASRIALNRIDGLQMLNLLLPGQAYTYYGDEIAMLDTEITWIEIQDPMANNRRNETSVNVSRDPARTPMQWNSNISAGFSTNHSTYLPVHPKYTDRNVELQEAQETSNLKTYKQLALLRKNVAFTHGDYELSTLNNDHVLLLKRWLRNDSVFIIVLNLGLRQETVNLTTIYPNLATDLEVVVASSNSIYTGNHVSRDNITLTANAAFVLEGHELETSTDTSHSTNEPPVPSTNAPSKPVTTTRYPVTTPKLHNGSTNNIAPMLYITAIFMSITILNF